MSKDAGWPLYPYLSSRAEGRGAAIHHSDCHLVEPTSLGVWGSCVILVKTPAINCRGKQRGEDGETDRESTFWAERAVLKVPLLAVGGTKNQLSRSVSFCSGNDKKGDQVGLQKMWQGHG